MIYDKPKIYLKKLILNLENNHELLSNLTFYCPQQHLRMRQLFYLPKLRVNRIKHSPIYKLSSIGNKFNLNTIDIYQDSLCTLRKKCIATLLNEQIEQSVH